MRIRVSGILAHDFGGNSEIHDITNRTRQLRRN